MALIGTICLVVALVAAIVSVLLFWTGHVSALKGNDERAEKLANLGYYATMLAFIALTASIALLVYCFFTHDYTIEYVAQNHSSATGGLAWLYTLSGVWAGRAGSLLFWAWLISLFASVIAYRRLTESDALSNIATSVMQLVLIAFLGVLIFSTDNNPFIATAADYLADDGTLVGTAASWGMNVLLEHWAMAIHPVTLFIGYAGLTVPFAYAVSALVVNDPSRQWVKLSQGYAVFSWIFLGIGIGLGAVWAYAVLGWGGYWAWDPVENASLLPWLVGVALIHTLTMYRRQGSFKRWAIFCACLTFAFVVLGTFITRSGLVESVHAFSGDSVSFWFFIILIISALLIGVFGLVWRRKSFVSDVEISSFSGREAAYYFNNVIMVASAVLLAYLTLTSALPSWMPYGGKTVDAGTYETVARIIGIFYFLLMAVCPMLSWHKTEGHAFWKKALVPGLCALGCFALLMVLFATQLLPSYESIVASGGTAASELLAQGPSWYYNGIAVLGFLVASLLLFNTIFAFCRDVGMQGKAGEGNGLVGYFRNRATRAGGLIVHAGMAVMLIGLVGSTMYVSESVVYLDEGAQATVDSYTVTLDQALRGYDGNNLVYGTQVTLSQNGTDLSQAIPNYEITMNQQQKSNAAIFSMPLTDVFVAYQGNNSSGQYSLDIRVNPLIGFVWAGLILLVVGAALSFALRNRGTRRADDGAAPLSQAAGDGAPARTVASTSTRMDGGASARIAVGTPARANRDDGPARADIDAGHSPASTSASSDGDR